MSSCDSHKLRGTCGLRGFSEGAAGLRVASPHIHISALIGNLAIPPVETGPFSEASEFGEIASGAAPTVVIAQVGGGVIAAQPFGLIEHSSPPRVKPGTKLSPPKAGPQVADCASPAHHDVIQKSLQIGEGGMQQKRRASGRAAGPGRKPQGEFSGMSKPLTIRLEAATRRQIEDDAKRNGRSVSQEITARLREALDRRSFLEREFGKPHNYALAAMTANLAKVVESTTDKRWLDDKFTAEAIGHAVGIFLQFCAPKGSRVVPELVRKQAKEWERFGPEIADHCRSAFGVGSRAHEWTLGDLLTEEEGAQDDQSPAAVYSQSAQLMSKYRRALRLEKVAYYGNALGLPPR
jgi:hypothetical protein